MVEQGFRVTYATMTADNEELHSAYDEGIEQARKWLGQRHPFYVNGEPREGEGWFEERSPVLLALMSSFVQPLKTSKWRLTNGTQFIRFKKIKN